MTCITLFFITKDKGEILSPDRSIETCVFGLEVVDAPPSVDQAMMDLLKFYMARDVGLPKTTVRPSPGQTFKLYIAWLDSINKQIRVEQDTLVEKDNQARPVGDRWVEY